MTQKDDLASSFPEDLAYISTFRDEPGLARFYIMQTYEKFLSSWSTLPELASNARHQQLQVLQATYELEEFHDFLEDNKSFKGTMKTRYLINEWKDRYPSSKFDDVLVWERVVNQRVTLLTKLAEKYKEILTTKREVVKAEVDAETIKEQKRADYSEVKQLALSERSEIYRKMASGVRKQNNFSVADKYLRLSLKAMEQHSFDFPFFHTLVKLHCLKAENSPATESVEKFVKALKYLDGKRVSFSIFRSPT